MTDKQKLKKAIKLLEMAHFYINSGASFDGKKLGLIPYIKLKNEVQAFVKDVKPDTKLKKIKVKYGHLV